MMVSRLVAGLALLAVLSGCTPTPAPVATSAAPRPPAAASPTPTPTPTPAPDRLVVLTETVSALDNAGDTVASFTYFDDAAAVVARLTEFFGFEPTVTVVPRRPSDAFAGTRYDWDGFQLSWIGFEDEPGSGTGSYPLSPPLFVTVSAPSVRGIAIEGPDGVMVGDPFEPLVSANPEYNYEFTDAEGSLNRTVIIGLAPTPPAEYNDGTFVWGIAVRATGGSDSVTMMSGVAPANYGL